MALDPVTLFASAVGIYFLLLAGFAAITTAQALEEDDRVGLPMRVYWSLTKTTLFLGLPALIALLILVRANAGPGQGSGIMTNDTAVFVFFFVGALGLLIAWLGAITLGFVGSAIARNLPPTLGAGVLFLIVCGAPALIAVTTVATAAAQKRSGHRP